MPLMALLVSLATAQAGVPMSTTITNCRSNLGIQGDATLTATGGFVEERVLVDGAWVQEGRQPLSVSLPTSRPGVTSVLQSTAVYQSAGGGWSFTGCTVGGSHLVGMPDPTPEEVALLAERDALFSGQDPRWREVVKFWPAKLPQDPNIVWDNFETVEVDLDLGYATVEGQELVTWVERRRMRLERPGDTGPFTQALVVSHNAQEKSRKAVPAEDAAAWPTLWEQDFLDTVVQKDLPAFTSTTEACRFAYDTVRGGASDEDVFWTLFWMMSSEYLVSSAKLVPNGQGQAFLEGVKASRAEFQRRYPDTFTADEASGDYVYFARTDGKARGHCRVFLMPPDGSHPESSPTPVPAVITHFEVPIGDY